MVIMICFRVVFPIFVLNSIFSEAGVEYDDVDGLISHLFNETRYKKHIRPVRDQSKTTQVGHELFIKCAFVRTFTQACLYFARKIKILIKRQ